MSSPSKKRKLNNGGKQSGGQPKSLEFFFAKQRQNNADPGTSSNPTIGTADVPSTELTDEELARKLQAEWDQEVEDGSKIGSEKTRSASPSLNPVIGGPAPSSQTDVESVVKVESKVSSSLAKTLTLQSTGTAEDAITTSIPLDEPPLIFEPSKYLSSLKEHWAAEDGNASYALLTRCFFLVSGTASRIKIVDTLVNCLRLLIEGDPESLLPAVSCLLA